MTKIKKQLNPAQIKLQKLLNSNYYRKTLKDTSELISTYVLMKFKRGLNKEEKRIVKYLAEPWPEFEKRDRRRDEELDIALRDANATPKDSIKY